MELTMIVNGFVGHDIELKYTKTGVPTVNFRVATTPRIKTDTGWENGTTTWTTVVCYRGLAEHVSACVRKGDPVIVHGKVRTQAWTDAQGAAHEKQVLEAKSVGYDLSHGAAAFTRGVLRSDPPSDASACAQPPSEEEPMSIEDEFEDAELDEAEELVAA